MQKIASAVLVALFSLSSGRMLDATTASQPVTATYGTTAVNAALNCGQCIGTGYHYCIQKQENTQTNAYITGSTQQVCIAPGTTGTQFNDPAWSCSNAFADRVYAKYVCQANTAACGTTTSYALTNTTQSITITSLALGQTCFYRLSAACGAPAFKPSDVSRVEVEYVEFRTNQLNGSDAVVGYGTRGSNDDAKRAGVPLAGMPRRNQYFSSELGGNNIANGNITTYNAATNGTIIGRSGRYDKLGVQGRKVYGNPQQGDAQLGNKTDSTLADCLVRNLYLAVTATTDAASLRIDVNTVDFYQAPGSTASMLKVAVASVLTYLAISFV